MLIRSTQELSVTKLNTQEIPILSTITEGMFAPHPKSRQRTFHYVKLLIVTLLGIVYGVVMSEIFFPGNKQPVVEFMMTIFKLTWLIPLPYALVNFYAYLRFPPFRRPPWLVLGSSMSIKLYFRYVTRGNNLTLVAENVGEIFEVLSNLFTDEEWAIEVVTDIPLDLDDWEDNQVKVVVVPPDYQAPNGAKYKARALQYALENSSAQPKDWIIHLDEETRFDSDTIRAIHNFVKEQRQKTAQRRQQYPAIGQGVIMYGRGRVVNWVTTLADSIRVADDYGRFRFQFSHGKAYFGLHGSFVVINAAVEQMIGFDHGVASSITEDSYFALVAQQLGVPFQFIPAFMYERSPFTIRDFIQQRRRWFGGLWMCVRHGETPLKERFILGAFMFMWSTSWLCLVMTIVNILFPTGTPLWLSLLAGLTFIYNVMMYLIGFVMTYRISDGRLRYTRLLLMQIALIPLFSLMEGSAVIYALISPPSDFFVVQKEDKRTRTEKPEFAPLA